MPKERIAAFIRGESGEAFAALALELFREQWDGDSRFRALCRERGASPERVAGWRDVPPLPAAALDGEDPAAQGAGAGLARLAIERSFPAAFLQGTGRPPLLSLAPPAEESADTAASLLADWALAAWAAPDSLVAATRRGVEVARARSFLGARQRDRRPTVVLGTPAALGQLLAALDRRGLRFRLPAGSRVIAGGGEPSPDLLTALATGLAVPAEAVLREYAPIGTATRFYAGYARRGEPRPFVAPPWARARVLDPTTLEELPRGTEGALAIFDLARAAPPAHLIPGDHGVADEDGFYLTALASSAPASR